MVIGTNIKTGIIKHIDKAVAGKEGDKFYGYTWSKQSFHKDELGMAIIADQATEPSMIKNDLSHVYVFSYPLKKKEIVR